MKLIHSSRYLVTLGFTRNELEILNRVLDVPLLAFGLEKFLTKINVPRERIAQINKKIRDTLQDIDKKSISKFIAVDFKRGQIYLLKDAFSAACDIVDEKEIHTLTGYSWRDAIRVQKNLTKLINQLRS